MKRVKFVRSAMAAGLAAVAFAMAAASAFAEEKKREDVDVSADPGKIGDAAGVVGELGGPSKKTLDAVDKVNEANKKDFENRKAVDDKMDLEAQQKYNDSLQGKNAAKRGYTQSVEKHTQAVRNEKNAGYNLHRKEVTQYKTNQKYNDSKLKYENALKRNDPNVHKYEFEMNKNKAALDKANTDVTEAKQRFEQSKVETSNAQKNVEVQKAKLDEATEKFNKAAKNKEIVNKSNTTKGKKPTQVSPKETTTQKITKTIGDVVTTTDLGSKVYDYREAVNSGDTEGQRNALFGLSESTLTALAASNPETAAVMAAYNTGKTVKQTVDQAADAERAKSEARDGIKGAQAVQIAADLMSASRDPKTGKPTMTVEEALHRADGYVFGYGDKDNTEFVESMYNDGKVKDKNGNPKPMPKEDELHKMSVVEIIKNSGEGIKDAFVGLGENAAKTFIAAKETGADLLDAGKSLLTEKGVAWETIKGTGNDIADNAHAVGTGLVNSDYWKDRAEAVDAALKGAWDGAKENYDALTGKKSTEQTMKDDQRAMEYKLVEMGMSQKDASRVANEFYNGNNSAAMQEIKEFKSGLSDSEKMQGDINRIQKEKEDILKQIQELGGKDPAKQKELMDEYKRLTENQNNLKTTQQGLRELEEDEKKRAEKEAKEKAEKDAKVGEEKGKKNADENKEEKKDGDNEGKKAEDEQKTTEGEEGKKADEDNQKTEGDPKTTEGDPKATEGDPKTTEGDPKTNETDPKTTETDPKTTEEEKNTGDNENKQTAGGERHKPETKEPKEPKEPQEPKNPEDENDTDNEKNDNDLRTSEGNTPTDPNGEGSQIPNGPAGPSLSGFLGKWLEEQGQKFLENNNLNQHTWQEYEQAYRNAIAQQNAQQTVSQGGQTAQQISTDSANATANAQQENSWGKHLSDAVQQSVTAGLSSLGSSFGNAVGSHVANELLKDVEKDDHGNGGGGDGGGEGGGGEGAGAGGGAGGAGGESGGHGEPGESGESEESGNSGESGEAGENGGHGESDTKSGGSGESDSNDAKKSDSGGATCTKCGVSLSKIPIAAFSKENICEACRAEDIAQKQKQVKDGTITCDKCGAKVSIAVNDVLGYATLCHACEAKLLREKAGMSSASGSSSSSRGPHHKGCGGSLDQVQYPDQGGVFWKCTRCGHEARWGDWCE